MSSDLNPEAPLERASWGAGPTPSNSPAEAHRAMLALLHDTVVEAARRRHEELVGLVESLQDDVVLTTGGTSRTAAGWFAERAWRYGDRHVHELFLNADRRTPDRLVSPAEDVLTTLLHEACHVWAQMGGVRDTSRNGRYHNRNFGRIALAIGLLVEKDPVIGHRTPGLAPWARADYADLLAELDRGLVLAREPKPAKAGGGLVDPDDQADDGGTTSSPRASASSTKYVFASCRCQVGRRNAVTIRVAKGSWRPGVIRCAACQEPFVESL